MNLNKHQFGHSALRESVAHYIESRSASSHATDAISLRRRASEVRKNGTWVSEDVILATADYLQSDIHVFMASDRASPLIYSADASLNNPILVAFYEPGHYRAAVRACDKDKIKALNSRPPKNKNSTPENSQPLRVALNPHAKLISL